jgi:glucosaminylphosphatidylinositol acyltransferase
MSRAEKEAAVFGQKGTTLEETALIVATMPFLLSACPSRSFVEDVLEIALPLLIAETIAAEYLPFGVYTIPFVCLLVRRWSRSTDTRLSVKSDECQNKYLFTVLRGTTVLFTVIAILAVDFPVVFPRRYVKTEWYGAGLMDIGVGAYVFTGAVVRGSRRKAMMSGREVVTTAVVFVMGFARAYVNKSVDYQEHVSEYGVHWNFFVTLILVKLLSDSFSRFIARGSAFAHIAAGLIILIGHQYLLSYTEIGLWVMEDSTTQERKQHSLFWQNKEGFVSLTGYVAIDLCTRGSASWLLEMKWWQLGLADVALWVALRVSRTLVQDICRRSANAPYVIWIFAIGVMLLSLTETFVDPRKTGRESPLMGALSRNQFPVFIVSNLLTGLVNLTNDTLHTPMPTAMGVLAVYVVLVCTVAYALELSAVRNKVSKQDRAA